MLELPSPISPAFPAHWFAAALPQAQICQLQDAGLMQLETGVVTAISSALQRGLQAAPAECGTLVVFDQTGAPWRLRRLPASPPGFWLLQSLAESRRIALQNFRSVLAARLAGSLLHELRNPLNALGLQCELLGRVLKSSASADAQAQAAARVTQMKERLRELLERQNSLVGLWLAEPDCEAPSALAQLIGETLRLLRSYGAQHEVRVQADDLSALGRVASPLDDVAIKIVLIAIGLLAIESEVAAGAAGEDAQVLLQTASVGDGDAAALEIRADFTATKLLADLQIANFAEWLATLALLLDGQPIELGYPAANNIRLRFRL